MKCVNCNKEIPDTSVICPFCNTKVDPIVTATPEFDVPEEANAPVITGKEGMVVNNSPMQAAPGMETPAPVDVALPETPTVPQLPSDQNNLVVETAAQPIITEEQINAAVTEEPEITETLPEEPGLGVIKPVAPATEDSVPTVESSSTVGSINEEEPKKKGSAGKILMIIGIVVVVLIAIAGGYFYFSEFKSADKRINTLARTLFKAPLIDNLNNIDNSKIELASGSYEYALDVNYGTEKIAGTVFGKYGIDTKNKMMDVTVNVKDVQYGGNELISAKNPLNLEFYSNEDRLYVLLENFFNKYIYFKEDNVGTIYDAIEQNDFDYAAIINAYEEAIIAGLDATSKKQDISSITFGGKKQSANVVTVKFDKNNINAFTKGMYNSLKNNKKFVSQMAKLTGVSEKDIQDGLKADDVDTDSKLTLELYSGVLVGNFIGVKITTEVSNGYEQLYGSSEVKESKPSKLEIEVSRSGDKYNIVAYKDSQKVLSLQFGETITKSAKETTHTGGFEGSIYSNDTTFSIKLTYKVVNDVNPSVKKVDTTNSVAFESLTQEDLTNILNKVYDFGLLGQIVKQYTTLTPSYGYGIDNCSPGMNCVKQADYSSMLDSYAL